MKIDFSTITIYELLALILSASAILIPFMENWIKKPVLHHLPTGRAFLFINRYGSYMQIEGVFEALNKPISVKNITLKISKRKNCNEINLRWNAFTSLPISQRIAGNYGTTLEAAHPFRIEADSIFCAFIEFSDFYNSFSKTFQLYYDGLVRETVDIHALNLSYEEAYSEYQKSKCYMDAKSVLEKELFWEVGEYEVCLNVMYGKKSSQFKYKFSVDSNEYKLIKLNLEEALLVPLKTYYKKDLSFHSVQVELKI